MVRKTFNAKLRSVAGKFRWVIDGGGGIRGYAKSKKKALKNVDFCPLTAVYYALKDEILDASDYDKAAKELGVSDKDAEQIVHLADNSVDYLEGHEISSRQWLLKNVGLKPEVKHTMGDLW